MAKAEALARLAADCRVRGEAAMNIEERARCIALADYCDHLAMGMQNKRKGPAVRLADAMCSLIEKLARPVPSGDLIVPPEFQRSR